MCVSVSVFQREAGGGSVKMDVIMKRVSYDTMPFQ